MESCEANIYGPQGMPPITYTHRARGNTILLHVMREVSSFTNSTTGLSSKHTKVMFGYKEYHIYQSCESHAYGRLHCHNSTTTVGHAYGTEVRILYQYREGQKNTTTGEGKKQCIVSSRELCWMYQPSQICCFLRGKAERCSEASMSSSSSRKREWWEGNKKWSFAHEPR